MILAVENIGKTFAPQNAQAVTALDGISFTVQQGGITAFVGPDGAGKTTMLRLVAGLLRQDTGSLTFYDDNVEVSHAYMQEHLSYMPQKFGLYEDLTVQENIALYANLKNVPRHIWEERATELLQMCAMLPFRKRLAGNLSGGMKQKLGLVCTLVAPPKLLLLDEPTVGVDPLSRRELWEIIHKLTAKFGMSVLVSTAYLDEASQCGDVILFYAGKILAQGSPKTLIEKATGKSFIIAPIHSTEKVHPRTLQAQLLASKGIVDAVPQGGSVRIVCEPPVAQKLSQQSFLSKMTINGTAPCMEDAFMLLLQNSLPKEEKISFAQPMENKAFSLTAYHSDTQPPVIETKHVSRLFGDFIAVNDVSFSVYKGEVFGLLGPNGAGKTTTFRMLCGLLPPSKGALYVAGVDVRKARAKARSHLGYVAQKFSLYGPLSVLENLDFFAGAYGLHGKEKKRRIQEMLVEFSLESYAQMAAENLPGGYKQRLAMAVGLLHKPAILFLDEPTSGADPLARREFWQRISALAEQGVTAVVTTHFMEEAEYCDRVIIQDSGVMLAMGTPEEIRAKAVAQHDAQGATTSESALGATASDSALGATASESALGATMEDAFIAIVSKARAEQAERTKQAEQAEQTKSKAITHE